MLLKNKNIIITIILLINFSLAAKENKNFEITLQYYSRPVITREWKISIYRTKDKFYIKSEKYLYKTFTKRISYKRYTILLKKLNKLGIRNARGCYPKNSQNEFYKITLKTKNFTNQFKVPSRVPLYGKNAPYYQMIRLIQNLAKETGSDL